MKTSQSSLVADLARMRESAQADSVHRGWLASALSALILALLARLFGRLECLAQAWQAGELPTPAHPSTQRRTRRSPRHPEQSEGPTLSLPRAAARPGIAAFDHQADRPTQHPPKSGRAGFSPPPVHRPLIDRCAIALPPIPALPGQARAPPPKKCPRTPPPTHAQNVTI